jgi:hypothetical protein
MYTPAPADSLAYQPTRPAAAAAGYIIHHVSSLKTPRPRHSPPESRKSLPIPNQDRKQTTTYPHNLCNLTLEPPWRPQTYVPSPPLHSQQDHPN